MTDLSLADNTERRFLIKTALLDIDQDTEEEIQQIIKGGLDWEKVTHDSLMHGTVGLLYKKLSQEPFKADIPDQVLEKIKNMYLFTAASGMKQMANFKPVAEDLVESGIEIIILKGAVLAETLYGDIGLRPMSDIDILVRENDWPKIFEILKKHQYSSIKKDIETLPPKLTKYDIQTHMQFTSANGTVLEFQFDLFTIGIGMRDIDGVWERSRKVTVGDVEVGTLSPEDQILHLLIHANRHGCSRLKWLVDVAEILRQRNDIDWGVCLEIAQREKLQASLYMTLKHVEKVFECQLLPEDIMEKLKPRKYKRVLWKCVWPEKQIDVFGGRDEDGICFHFYRIFSGWNIVNYLLMGRMRDKLAYQARWLVPSMTWMSKNYDEAKSITLLRYYPVRMVNYKMRKKR